MTRRDMATAAYVDLEHAGVHDVPAAVTFIDQSDSALDPPAILSLPRPYWVMLGEPTTVRVTIEVRCRECGCTDTSACTNGCRWVAPGLCSSCMGQP